MTTLLIVACALTLAGLSFYVGLICGGGLVKAAQAEPLREIAAEREAINTLFVSVADLANLNGQILSILRERQAQSLIAVPVASGRPN